LIFSIKPQIFELKCVFSYFRLKTHITLLLPVYVHSWEQRKFSDLVQIERGGSPRPIDDFITDSPDGLNWVKIGDAPAQGNYITKTAEKIKPEGLSKTREVHPGDLILSNSMSFGKPYIMGIDGCIHDGWLLIRNTYKVFDLTFLCHLLGTPQMIIQYKSLAAGSTVNNLNKELVGNTVVTIPTIKEQRVLGQYLETLDNLITLHQCKCQIDGCRFQSPLAITWEQRKVTEIGKIYIGLVTTMTKHYTDEGTLLIRNSDIKDGKFEFGDNPIYLEKTFAEKNETRMHQIGDVITVHTGDVGTSAVITENEAKSIGFATIVTRPNPKIIDSNYLCSFLNTDKHKKWAVSISTGDGRTNYNLGDYFELVVPVPSIAEQKKIASYIQKLNRLITLHQCE
jgi:type I restriction enzyme S subunit